MKENDQSNDTKVQVKEVLLEKVIRFIQNAEYIIVEILKFSNGFAKEQ